MASVDLSELIGDLEAAVTVPGAVSPFATSSETEWLTRLRNAFWSAYNDGIIAGFTCDEDGIVNPSGGGDSTFTRDLQQLVIMYAAINIYQNQIMQLKTLFRAKAGQVEYETQQSAQVIKSLLDSLLAQRATILQRLSDGGFTDSYYIDAIRSRDDSLRYNFIDWNG
jgi:hypothetical protein